MPHPLLRATTELPALRATELRAAPDDPDVALTAAMADTAHRSGTERWAAGPGSGSVADVVDSCPARLATPELL